MFDQPPELSPDLEWMLQSGQVSREMLAEALVAEYYPSLYRLGSALLGRAQDAPIFAREGIQKAILEVHNYKGQISIQAWILRQALSARRRTGWNPFKRLTQLRPLIKPIPSSESGQRVFYGAEEYAVEDAVTQMQELLGDYGYPAVCLHFLLGLDIPAIASALKTSERAVEARLAKARQICRSCLWPSQMEAEEIDDRLGDWMQERYPPPELAPAGLDKIKTAIIAQSGAQEKQHKRFTYFRELVLVGFAIATIGGLMWGLGRMNPDLPTIANQAVTEVAVFNEDSVEIRDQLSPSIDYRGLSPSIEPLDLDSSIESVVERMSAAELNWQTKWQDIYLIFYGPPGYIGPPEALRAQVWMGQSNQVKLIAGPLGSRPEHQFISRDKGFHHPTMDSLLRWYYRIYDRHLALGVQVDHHYLPVARLAETKRKLAVRAVEVVAGHQALVVDQINRQGDLESRMWVDTVAGVVLRKRVFAQSDPQMVILDAITNQISYNREFPADAFDPQTDDEILRFTSNYIGVPERGNPAQGRERPAVPITIWAPRASRERFQSFLPPPEDFDPSASRISFQITPVFTSLENQSDKPKTYAQIFAANFYLNSLYLGDPFSVICDRSQNGELVALAQGRKSQARKDSWLSWLNLSNPREVNTVDLEVDLAHFAFAPDSRRLALFGFGRPLGSLYILDTASGALRKLLNLEYVRSLMWSPDGEQLGIIGNWESPEYNEEVMIIDPETGKVIDYSAYNYRNEQIAANLPSWLGEKSFPQYMGGMEACVEHPQNQIELQLTTSFTPSNPNSPLTK